MQGRATDDEGNTYLYENDSDNGILQRIIVSIAEGNKIEQAKRLKEQGYTQVQIADMLGVSQSTISKWLNM